MFDLLVIAPHPDDAEIFCGGMIALTKKLGKKVAIVDLVEGELASRGSVQKRRQETKRANSILDVDYRINLRIPDGFINQQFVDQAQGETILPQKIDQEIMLVHEIRELKPKLILAPYFHDRHPDHYESAQLIKRAIFMSSMTNYEGSINKIYGNSLGKGVKLPAPHQHLQTLLYPFRNEVEPTFIVDISKVFDKKMKAIKAYSSQVGLESKKGDPKTLISSALGLKSFEARDRYFGSKIGVEYGEPYVSTSYLKMTDPFSYFERNVVEGGLFFPNIF